MYYNPTKIGKSDAVFYTVMTECSNCKGGGCYLCGFAGEVQYAVSGTLTYIDNNKGILRLLELDDTAKKIVGEIGRNDVLYIDDMRDTVRKLRIVNIEKHDKALIVEIESV